MINKRIFNEKGVTLIELLIVIAITTVVIAASFSLLNFGNISFSRGNAQHAIQTDSRTVSDYIQENLRYATYVEIINLSEMDSGIANINNEETPQYYQVPFKYIYFDVEEDGNTGRLVHKTINTALDDEEIIESNDYQIQFQTLPTIHSLSFGKNNSTTLSIHALGVDKEPQRNVDQVYSLKSNINLPNINLENLEILEGEEDDSGLEDVPENYRIAIRYSTNFDFVGYELIDEGNNSEDVFKLESVTGTNNTYFVLTFSKDIANVISIPNDSTENISEGTENAIKVSSNSGGQSGFGNHNNQTVEVSDNHGNTLSITVAWNNNPKGWYEVNH